MDKYKRLTDFLKYLDERYNAKICIKDFVGFIPINKQLDYALNAYLAHTNPYCMFVKKDKERYRRCLSCMPAMYEKCSTSPDGYWGMCYAGIYEYIFPIILDNEVLGVILIGVFPGKDRLAYYLMRRTFQHCGAETINMAQNLFRYQIESPIECPIESLRPMLLLLADYLAQTYKEFRDVTKGLPTSSAPRQSSEDTVISHVIEYIRQNYMSKITVKKLATVCHCCESYINHTFSKRTGVNISTYMNKVRVERAKELLLTTKDPISQVATQTGFSDPNYFTRVFTNLVGITPSEFRRRYS